MKKNKDLQQYTPKLAQNQVKKTPTVTENDLFSTTCSEHPSFEELNTQISLLQRGNLHHFSSLLLLSLSSSFTCNTPSIAPTSIKAI